MMQLKNALFALTLLAALSACQYSKGVKKDLNTGLTASYKGFGVENVFLADAAGKPLKNNTVVLGTKLKIIADGVEHYEVVDKKVFPGCSIALTSPAGDSVLYVPDAFANLAAGQPAEQATMLSATLTTGEPMVAGQEYLMQVRFFDKKDNTRYIKASCPLKVVAPQ